MTPRYAALPQESRRPLDGKLMIMDVLLPEGNRDLFLSELKVTQDIGFPSLSAVPLPALPSEDVQSASSIIRLSYTSLTKPTSSFHVKDEWQ